MEVRDNRIFIGGRPVEDIAEEFGTPVYVYHAEKIKDNYRSALQVARSVFDSFDFYYPIKACNNLAVAELLVREGAGIDAASMHEVRLAKALGLDGSKIMFSGNYLSDDDLRESLHSGAIVNLDDESMLPRLLKYGTPEIISFRVNPGFGDSLFGDKLTNAGPGAKFGVHEDHVLDAYRAARDAGISRFGVHMMPGSCVLDPRYFHHVTHLLMNNIFRVISELDISFEFIDLGGGLGIPYSPDEVPLDFAETMSGIAEVIRDQSKKYGVPVPKIVMEPGRYFIGNAGYVIGRVHTIKRSYSTILGTDISMNTLARPAMYDAYHKIYIDGKEGDPKKVMGLCGQICENTDFWCKDREFPETVKEGDLVVVCDVGAYGYVMSYEYNGRLRPAEVLVESGEARLIRRREDLKDMVRNMIVSDEIAERLRALNP